MGLKRRNLEAKVDACIIENFCDLILSSEENLKTESSLKSKKFDLVKKKKKISDTKSMLNCKLRQSHIK